MKKISTGFTVILLLLFTCFNSYAQDIKDIDKNPDTDIKETVKLPVNLYDTFTFSEGTTPYARTILYFSGPVFMTAYGFYLWDWGRQPDFNLKPETHIGAHAINGAADKFGHSYANFVGARLFAFLFRATGSSKNRSIIEGALLTELTSLIGEFGDGFSPNYGFDPYDIMFNQFGILFGMLLNWSPFLDRMITFKWEYWPSPRVRNHLDKTDRWDISTDYNDSKYILVLKLGGVPYVSLTPLRYVNLDFGYYTRGYRHTEEYPSRTRNIFFGLSINFTIGFGDILPVGYTSSTLQSIFNYYHPPLGWEAKKWVMSDRPHSEFD